MVAMAASRRHSLAARLLVLCLLCGACAAAKRRYLSVSVGDVLRSKARVDAAVVASGNNKLTVQPACVFPCGNTVRHVLSHDMDRLIILLQRSSADPVPRSPVAQAPAASPGVPMYPPVTMPGEPMYPPVMPSEPMYPPVPAVPGIPISYPPVQPPAEAPAVRIPDSTGASLDTLEFVVTVGFGTPARPYTVIFDTGSDLSWIQCLPCSGHCYRQHDPVFDPSESSTYGPVPCGDPRCAAAHGRCSNATSGGGADAACLYSVGYGDGSSTSGVLARDTLSLTSSRGLPGFAFGCGQQNLGDFGSADGLLGLGRGELSLSSQAAASLGAAFSYCLPSSNTSHGYLTIGSATPAPSGDDAQFTAMVRNPRYPSFYFVDLVSIDIGGYVLPVPPAVFTGPGTLLDSGTVLTYLPPEAYAALRDRFKFTMEQYKPAPAHDALDTCYDFTGQAAIFIPAVSLKFSDGAVFDLDFFGILVFPPEESGAVIGCLGFAARPPMMPFNVIGNTQQRSAEVIYDVAAEKIGFVPTSC